MSSASVKWIGGKQFVGMDSTRHTVVLSTHILPEVDMTCERVIIINEGKVVAEDSTRNLRTRLPQEERFMVDFRGESPGLKEKIEKIPGVVSVTHQSGPNGASSFLVEESHDADVRSVVARTILDENLELLQLRDLSLTLEDIFIKVTMK